MLEKASPIHLLWAVSVVDEGVIKRQVRKRNVSVDTPLRRCGALKLPILRWEGHEASPRLVIRLCLRS